MKKRNEHWLLREWRLKFQGDGYHIWRNCDRFAKGRPDLILFKPGLPALAVEAKFRPGEPRDSTDPLSFLTPHQLDEREALLQAGVLYQVLVGWGDGTEARVYYAAPALGYQVFRREGPGRWKAVYLGDTARPT